MTQTQPEQPSANTPPRSQKMQLVAEKRIPDANPQPQSLTNLIQQNMPTGTSSTASSTTDFRSEYVARAAWKQGVLGALNVLIAVVAVRFIVLIAIGGGIALSVMALQNADPWRLGALAIYAVAIVLPTVWMASRR